MNSFSVRRIILACIIVFIAVCGFGCNASQPGETAAEGSRRHSRVFRINNQELMADTDRATLLDKPSKLTDKRLP